MARLGVTYQDIENAANQLTAQGKQPTIELVRQFLGTGSSTTIANHLRRFRAEQDGRLNLARTENLPKEMITSMKGLWDQLCANAENKINANEVKYQQEIAELQQALQKYKANNQRWQQLFNQWQQEKEQLSTTVLTLEQGIEVLQKEQAVLQAKLDAQIDQLQDKQIRIEELHRLHSQAQTNLEHYRESAREQRIIEQQQFEQQNQALQSENKALKEQIVTLQKKSLSNQQQYQLLQQAYHSQEKSQAEITSKLERQQNELTELQKAKNECEYASKHWKEQCQEHQKLSEAKIKELAYMQAENKILSTQLDDIKLLVNDLQDQNKLLGHEKWILAQEKAQLEGQLKEFKAGAKQN